MSKSSRAYVAYLEVLGGVMALGLTGVGCSDPDPPSAQVAMAFSITDPSGLCPATTQGRFSIGDAAAGNINPANGAGLTGVLGRLTDGQDNAEVSCRVESVDTGFSFDMSLSGARSIETTAFGTPLTLLRFAVTNGLYGAPAPGGVGNAQFFTVDSVTQRNYQDTQCAVTVHTFGGMDGLQGGAIAASFTCQNHLDSASPGVGACTLSGSMIFENCDD